MYIQVVWLAWPSLSLSSVVVVVVILRWHLPCAFRRHHLCHGGVAVPSTLVLSSSGGGGGGCTIDAACHCLCLLMVVASGNWWESAQPLYNIIIFSMCIHMHHFDIHLDHVSYSMGVFRVMVIFISLLYLWSTQSICLFLSCHIIIALLNAYDPNTQSLLDVIKCTYHHSHLCMCSDLSLFLLWSDFPIVILVGTIISSLMVLSLVNSILLIYLTKLDQLSLADIYDHVLLCLQ